MITYCLMKWDKNKNILEQHFKTTTGWNTCNYIDLVKTAVKIILNDNVHGCWNVEGITEIDNGEYQGTLIYLIPKRIYQPTEYDYIMTYIGYGSCDVCDTLISIQRYGSMEYLTDSQIKDFMMLSKDIITNIIKPYNNGWRHDKEFDEDMNKAHIMVLDQLVRCKNCKYNRGEVNSKGFYICSANGMDITDEDFCSWGEKKGEY